VYPWNDDLGQVDTDNPINVTRNESIRWDESSEFWPDLYNVTNQVMIPSLPAVWRKKNPSSPWEDVWSRAGELGGHAVIAND
jgi:hypothetical protein